RELAPQARDAVRNVVRGAVRIAMEEARGRGDAAPAAPGADTPGGPTRPAGGSLPAGRQVAGSGLTPLLPEQHGLTGWPELPGGVIPRQVESTGPQGLIVRGYPALVETPGGTGAAGAAVSLRILADATEQARAHRAGLRRLVLLETALRTARVTTRWTGKEALTLATSPYPSTEALVGDIQLAAVGALVDAWTADHGGHQVRDGAAYAELVAHVRRELEERVHGVVGQVVATLDARRELEAAIKKATSMFLLNTLTEVRDQAARLVHDGFVAATPPDRLVHLPRYLRAAQRRIERAEVNVHQDADLAWKVGELEDAYEAAVRAGERLAPDPGREHRLAEVRWMIEELRVSFFAQQLGTPVKVSEKRIRKALTEV
ncbi:MAG: DUF3418 domain-containing protein, partial [Georgenia sp.]